MSSLQEFFNYCYEKNLPLAIYRLPNEKKIKVVAQKKSSLEKVSNLNEYVNEKGFLFAPFYEDKTSRKIFIKAEIFCNSENLPKLNFASDKKVAALKNEKENFKAATQTQFFNYVKNIKREIQKNNFRKIVAARVVKKKIPKNFSPVSFFKSLCEKYPSAFVSLVYTNDYGLWIGASPEILLSLKNKKFETYSLAGTKENTRENLKKDWGEKEKEEQRIVTEYILKTFSSLTKEQPLIRGAETVAAGNLLHLKTTFTYKKIPVSHWAKVAERLHPTPAIAGEPKEKAISFICKNENRKFYSGYLGTVNLERETNLFVNLRCMNVLKNSLAIYVGCGITADSKLQDEWNETRIKSQTLLRVLK